MQVVFPLKPTKNKINELGLLNMSGPTIYSYNYVLLGQNIISAVFPSFLAIHSKAYPNIQWTKRMRTAEQFSYLSKQNYHQNKLMS